MICPYCGSQNVMPNVTNQSSDFICGNCQEEFDYDEVTEEEEEISEEIDES